MPDSVLPARTVWIDGSRLRGTRVGVGVAVLTMTVAAGVGVPSFAEPYSI